MGIATTLVESTSLPELRRAITLDPTHPELQRQLGLVYADQPEQLDPREALKHLRRAVELNPDKSSYWADLASTCESLGDAACAERSFKRSIDLSPMMPRLEWLTANYYLRANRPDAALTHFRRLLELAPEYASSTFSLCLRALNDPEGIFQKALPAGKDVALKLQYADFLSAHGRADSACRIWRQTMANASRFPFSLAHPYLERLLNLGRYQEALEVWKDLERRGIIARPDAESPANLVFNGSFEQVPLNTGFDWRYATTPYLSIDFSDARAYQGARCLRLDFTTKRNEDYEPVSQIVPVVPGQAYILTAYARSENVTSDSGPRLRVLDPNCPSCLDLSSESTVGTTPWHPVNLKFSAAAQTGFVRLSIGRPRSRTFPTEITGGFWVDAISLEPAPSGTSRVRE